MSRSELIELVEAELLAAKLVAGDPNARVYLQMNEATAEVLFAGHPRSEVAPSARDGAWAHHYWKRTPVYIRANMAYGEVEAVDPGPGDYYVVPEVVHQKKLYSRIKIVVDSSSTTP